MKQVEDFAEELALIQDFDHDLDSVESDFKRWQEAVMYKGPGMTEEWYQPETDLSEWKTCEIPSRFADIDPGLASHDGAVWFRTEFDLSQDWTQQNLEIWLGQIDDHDQVWLNGVYLGETLWPGSWSGYIAPAALLRPQGNVLVVRIFDTGKKGGFKGTPAHFDYYPEGDRSVRHSTAGTWRYRVGYAPSPDELMPQFPHLLNGNIAPNDYVSCLFNGMIAPLQRFPIKGVIWYQGEANAERAYQYRQLFPTLIRDWRAHWQQPELPFYFVQLANFLETSDLPNPPYDTWPELREAQFMTEVLPHTGMAVTIDIGEADDIHPKNKLDVGRRLAAHALHDAYGKDNVPGGPRYASHRIENDRIYLKFDQIGAGLASHSGERLTAFAITGADSVFHWAEARIEGDEVVVWARQVPVPVSVRYAWANNPAASLYNSEGFPASPFRTDDWPGITEP